jgi:hypothetical protein
MTETNLTLSHLVRMQGRGGGRGARAHHIACGRTHAPQARHCHPPHGGLTCVACCPWARPASGAHRRMHDNAMQMIDQSSAVSKSLLPSPAADKAMQDVFGAKYVSLHVRVTNQGAHHLYTQSLGYQCAAQCVPCCCCCCRPPAQANFGLPCAHHTWRICRLLGLPESIHDILWMPCCAG